MLEEYNPWWEYENWERYDKHIRIWKSLEIHWIPSWLNEISLEPFSLNFIYGPRQVGKTTGIKLLIKRLIEKGADPRSLFYINVEFFSDLKEFRDILNSYLEWKEKRGVKSCYIFLDEVTKLPGWDRILKAFIDLGKFDNDVITVTGSSSLHLTKKAESFPGRKGKGKKIEVLPLSFNEFLEVHGVKEDRFISDEKVRRLFRDYLEWGGFPLSINKIDFKEDFIESFKEEIYSIGKSVKIAKGIISGILSIVPSSTSFSAIAGKVGLSHMTVLEYVDIFEDLFLIGVAYLKEGSKVLLRREKKIFFRDPFIYKTFSIWTGEELKKDALLEFVVQEHLYRKFKEIYYYRNSYEIDAIAGDLKVEVKTAGVHRRYPKNVIILTEEEIPEFLIELFKG